MKIAGSGSIAGGEYNEEIAVSGSGKITGNVKCDELRCSGALKSLGDVVCIGDMKVSGSMNGAGNINAKNIKVAGACSVSGSMTAEEDIKISGSIKVGKDMKCSHLTVSEEIEVSGGIEADEIKIEGNVECGGLMNAEKIEISLERSGNRIASIGGSEISVYPGKKASFVNRAPLLAKIVGGVIGTLDVEESIEGDVISLERVKVPSVTGRIVKIGAGCEVDYIRYSEEIEVDPDAKVAKSEKI